jgi:hypothetical protein
MKRYELGPSGGDDTARLQTACVEAARTGGRIKLQAGSYRTTQGLELLLKPGRRDTDELAVSIFGEGSGCTEILCDGPEPVLSVFGGKEGADLHLRNRIEGIRLRGAKGLYIEHGAYFELDDIYLRDCDDAVVMVDTLSCGLHRVITSWCQRGILLKRGQVSFPNAVGIEKCHISGSDWGLMMIGGSELNYIGGSLEGCGRRGVGPDRCAIKIIDAGYEGAVALNLRDVYVEGTHGYADVWLVGGRMPSVYNISGSSFGRINKTNYAWHSIRIDNELSSNGLMTVNVRENGFWSTNGYEPSPTRRVIARTGRGPVKVNYAGLGNFFQDAYEVPVL